MSNRWDIAWFTCRADPSDVRHNAEQLKLPEKKRAEGDPPKPGLKVGDALWRLPTSIGPIAADHNHWAGWHLSVSEAQADWVARACAAYEAAGNKWPEDQ